MRIFSFILVFLLSISAAQAQSPYFAHNNGIDPESEADYPDGFFTEPLDEARALELSEESVEDRFNGLLGPTEDLELDLDALELPRSLADPSLAIDSLGRWRECIHATATGNYSGYPCTDRRVIGVRLMAGIETQFRKCVDEGLAAQGGGTTDVFHIEHVGIMGDEFHSPRSNHAIGRAIDITRVVATLAGGGIRTFTYAKLGNRPFYTALRECWGRVVVEWNDCPIYANNFGVTGSIGWENPRHRRHLHLSMPVCYKGSAGPRYDSRYFRR